ncbi:MAG: leucyl aminopeptidase [Actinobacteria bacterium]|nr:leucyl aminopeptidase [Actinomycetota bacterium]MSW79290.1 leucyl aminopeptidase [Actinomycetota bacterium]MSX56049.1 leucyl aminopeptidase [Actinomycetota bacterium]MSZ81649.1 leucyl aminopeptidase [Actinomycetota bacterium]MTB19260.1 leucyl aminopeptidase [Actinomycetota bacterium]
MTASVQIARSIPKTVDAVGVPVATTGAIPRALGLNRAALAAVGFEGKPGQTFVLPSATGPAQIAVGIGDTGTLDVKGLRTAAAALVRAAGKRATIATTLADLDGVDAAKAAQAVTEGALLAAYRYAGIKKVPNPTTLTALTLVVGDKRAVGARTGAERGVITADAATLARDLANTPPAHLTAVDMANTAVAIANSNGLTVEVFNRDQLAAMGCGGIVGVNKGSVEPPRMVRLTYMPRNPVGHLALVGKGVMFDSGGLSLKPSDSMNTMKMDMSGAAAVLAAMGTLKALKCKSKVTAYLMCTDNMPSGSAVKLGDVLTFRNGKTSEINNTDAEGRLILADGLSLAAEDGPDAIVDIATLTGACMVALGRKIAGVVSNNDSLVAKVRVASANTDEQVWQLPLEKAYRKQLDSNVADMKNSGGSHGGAITAALFLSEFVGEVPWAHLDIAGPMDVDADDGWLSKGATGFGTRLLIDLALGFSK